MAFCPRCAAPNIDSAVACAACGAPLSSTPGTFGAQPPPSVNPQIPGGEFTPRMNGLAVAGFIFAFLCSIVGLPMSIVAYSQCKKSNGMLRGEGLALAGIIIGSVMIFINIVARLAMK